jgi:hypothetical protein
MCVRASLQVQMFSTKFGLFVGKRRDTRDATHWPLSTWLEECHPDAHAHATHHPTIMSNNTGEGRREDALVKQRNQAREEYERQKQQLINETEKARPSAHRFVGQNDSMEDSLKNSTVGLVRLADF